MSESSSIFRYFMISVLAESRLGEVPRMMSFLNLFIISYACKYTKCSGTDNNANLSCAPIPKRVLIP